ncbi:hypothetical protein DPMN_111341 [Dreissena polymorpha]|uniref:Uncharacterized protein n=1 Tax=Dreissena polymorpha TaxID=45954 RepID=A0A9D4KDQ4_DREPO|nr:hypothetical protein DPMN_111341 [Dreissena polymorpha]
MYRDDFSDSSSDSLDFNESLDSVDWPEFNEAHHQHLSNPSRRNEKYNDTRKRVTSYSYLRKPNQRKDDTNYVSLEED